MTWIHWLNHVLGNDYGQRYGTFNWYSLWSGIGGAAPDILLFLGLAGWYWHHTCHVSRCFRFGRHQVPQTSWKTCRSHHPLLNGTRITAQHIADDHEEANR